MSPAASSRGGRPLTGADRPQLAFMRWRSRTSRTSEMQSVGGFVAGAEPLERVRSWPQNSGREGELHGRREEPAGRHRCDRRPTRTSSTRTRGRGWRRRVDWIGRRVLQHRQRAGAQPGDRGSARPAWSGSATPRTCRSGMVSDAIDTQQQRRNRRGDEGSRGTTPRATTSLPVVHVRATARASTTTSRACAGHLHRRHRRPGAADAGRPRAVPAGLRRRWTRTRPSASRTCRPSCRPRSSATPSTPWTVKHISPGRDLARDPHPGPREQRGVHGAISGSLDAAYDVVHRPDADLGQGCEPDHQGDADVRRPRPASADLNGS
jgi:hypothetical protein